MPMFPRCTAQKSGAALAVALLILLLPAAPVQAKKVIHFGTGSVGPAPCGPDAAAQPDCGPAPLGFAIPYYTMSVLPVGTDALVRATFDIGADGRVHNLVLHHDGLDREVERVLRAEVEGWVYRPARRDGRDVAWTGQELRFTLARPTSGPAGSDQVSEAGGEGD